MQCLRHKLEQGGSGLAVALGPPQEAGVPRRRETADPLPGSSKPIMGFGIFLQEDQVESHFCLLSCSKSLTGFKLDVPLES